jgi:hypothetical protein
VEVVRGVIAWQTRGAITGRTVAESPTAPVTSRRENANPRSSGCETEKSMFGRKDVMDFGISMNQKTVYSRVP